MSGEYSAGPITIFIPGDPKGKDRPRMAPGHSRPFTPLSTRKAEARIVEAWKLAGGRSIPEQVDGYNGIDKDQVRVPVKLLVALLLQRPESHFLANGELNSQGLRHPQPENRKPDVDNAVKLVMDALNKKAYKDDVRIVSCTVLRRWSKTRTGTSIIIEPEFSIGDWD